MMLRYFLAEDRNTLEIYFSRAESFPWNAVITHLMIYIPHIRLVVLRLQGMKQRELGRQK